MNPFVLTRRTFVGSALSLAAASTGKWIDLFDGRSLNGWTPSENKDSWKVVDGTLFADGPRSHLFYSGANTDFKNFELEFEASAAPGANSGVYFHTAFQEKGFPFKGFEVQVNNTAAGEGNYRERKRTGSLYGVRNVYKQIVADNTWFTANVLVRGKNIQIRIDGMLVVDYTEPTPVYIPPGPERDRRLDRGTFALQCHDPGSKARYRKIRVRPLADNATAKDAAEAPIVDDVFKTIIDHGRNNIPLVDFDVQAKVGEIPKLLKLARRDGFQLGIACESKSAAQYLKTLRGQLAFTGLRTTGTSPLDRGLAAQFDYILADAAQWTSVEAVLQGQPIDAIANLPVGLQTKPVLEAMAKHTVALLMNETSMSADFVKLAKQLGVKLSFGSGYKGAGPLKRCERGIALAKECRLTWPDFWVPGAWGTTKAVQRFKA
jgi:hypothetical protein